MTKSATLLSAICIEQVMPAFSKVGCFYATWTQQSCCSPEGTAQHGTARHGTARHSTAQQIIFKSSSSESVMGRCLYMAWCCSYADAYGHRVVPPMKAKEAAKLMAWVLGPDWQGTNASALISNVVCGVRRGMAVAPTGNQTKVADYQMVFVTSAQMLMLMCYFLLHGSTFGPNIMQRECA